MDMDEHDVIRFMGRFPDAINGDSMKSTVWMCSTCKTESYSQIPVECPSPCLMCSGIFFEKVSE